MKHLAAILLPLAFLASPLTAQFGADDGFNPFGKQAEAAPDIALVPENTTIVPGEPFKVMVRLTHPAGWHSYYANPGFIGIPLSLEWTLPAGFKAGPIEWQTPTLGHQPQARGYDYNDTASHFVTITPPADLETGKNITLTAAASWQICNPTGCKDQQGTATLTLETGTSPAPATGEPATLLKAAHATQPIRNSGWNVEVTDLGTDYAIKLTPPASGAAKLKDVYFFSSDKQTNSSGTQKLTDNGDHYILTVTKAKTDALDNPVKRLPHLSGIIRAESGWLSGDPRKGLAFQDISITSKPLESASTGAFLGILGGMLFGGLILNLMPCVFPVIGLKIMGFAQQAGEEKGKVVLHGITFAAGVLVSFWVLAGFLLSLRNKALAGTGEDVGWGYQLQNPYIVLSILLLMFVLALNMFGVFEIGTSATGVGGKLQSKQGLQGSFFSGVLATVVATPCSAPFLGAAIGAAFALPNIQFMLAFTAMAVGLALPYLFLSAFPHLVEKLPRPGPWMESFKQAMSFLLFATSGYLLWVYVVQTGLDFMLDIIVGLSLVAVGFWIYGRWNQPHRPNKTRLTAKILTLLAVAGGILITLPPDKDKKIHWEKWSNARVEQLLEDGTPVYVDFTATWCATCQVNKKNAYPQEIAKLFKQYGVVALKADKTSPNPEIEKKLQQIGRTAIPVNVLYVPGKDEPIITPELLTADYIRELITTNLKKPEKE